MWKSCPSLYGLGSNTVPNVSPEALSEAHRLQKVGSRRTHTEPASQVPWSPVLPPCRMKPSGIAQISSQPERCTSQPLPPDCPTTRVAITPVPEWRLRFSGVWLISNGLEQPTQCSLGHTRSPSHALVMVLTALTQPFWDTTTMAYVPDSWVLMKGRGRWPYLL